jgi:hypothetical protein
MHDAHFGSTRLHRSVVAQPDLLGDTKYWVEVERLHPFATKDGTRLACDRWRNNSTLSHRHEIKTREVLWREFGGKRLERIYRLLLKERSDQQYPEENPYNRSPTSATFLLQ